MRKVFNWLAGHGKRSFTLGPTPGQFIESIFGTVDHTDDFTRGARIAERCVTLSGIFYAASTGLAVGGPIGLAAGVGIAVAAKAAGLAAGGVAYLATDAINNKLQR